MRSFCSNQNVTDLTIVLVFMSEEGLGLRDRLTLEAWVGMVAMSLYSVPRTPHCVTSLLRKIAVF